MSDPGLPQHAAVNESVVRAALARAGFQFGRGDRVSDRRPGCVWVEVTGLTARTRARRAAAVKDALSEQQTTLWWRVEAFGRTRPWRPWRTWVVVRELDPEDAATMTFLLDRASPTNP